GHIDIIGRGLQIFDEVVVAMGNNPNKRYMFDAEERFRILQDSLTESGLERIRCERFSGLLIDYCRKVGAVGIIRGLRAVTDFEFEFQMGLANMDMAPEIETVFLLTDPRNIFISSSLIKEIAVNGGDVSRYLPKAAFEAIVEKLDAPS
ncbi:MAG: pantetheine-phosphate adenylyltransferase, partial [Deltaproteobacteria bacterium]